LQKHGLSNRRNQKELNPQGFDKWRGSPQVGSPEPGNERGSLQKHYSFKAKIPDEKARKGFDIRDEICKTGLRVPNGSGVMITETCKSGFFQNIRIEIISPQGFNMERKSAGRFSGTG